MPRMATSAINPQWSRLPSPAYHQCQTRGRNTWQGVSRLLPYKLQDCSVYNYPSSARMFEYTANNFLRLSDSFTGSTPTAKY